MPFIIKAKVFQNKLWNIMMSYGFFIHDNQLTILSQKCKCLTIVGFLCFTLLACTREINIMGSWLYHLFKTE